jgi:site-specific recombinase XerD
MNDYVGDFIKYLECEKKSKYTIEGYEKNLRDWVKFQFKALPTIEQLKNLEIKDFQAYKYKMRDKAESTQARVISAIKSFYEYLRVFEKVRNADIKELKCPKIPKKLPIYLTEAECNKLIGAVDKISNEYYIERNKAIIIIFINTGIRASELSNIKIADIRDNKLKIRGKGNKERLLTLNTKTLDAIKIHLKTRRDNGEYLIATNRGSKMSPNRLWQVVSEHAKHVKLKDISPHKLRHTAATIWLNAGASIFTIQHILGHEDIKTTQIYAHVTDQNIESVMCG